MDDRSEGEMSRLLKGGWGKVRRALSKDLKLQMLLNKMIELLYQLPKNLKLQMLLNKMLELTYRLQFLHLLQNSYHVVRGRWQQRYGGGLQAR